MGLSFRIFGNFLSTPRPLDHFVAWCIFFAFLRKLSAKYLSKSFIIQKVMLIKLINSQFQRGKINILSIAQKSKNIWKLTKSVLQLSNYGGFGGRNLAEHHVGKWKVPSMYNVSPKTLFCLTPPYVCIDRFRLNQNPPSPFTSSS